MNLVTNDASGLFLLPLGTTINLTSWDVFNELGLVFVPFLILYIGSWAKARTQGADEGSAGVLIIKYIEKGFYGYLAIIILFLTPIGQPIDVQYRQYSCLDNPSISSNAMKDINAASESALRALGINSDSVPIGVGLLHNVFAGVNGAAISQMSCSKGSSKAEVGKIVGNSIPKSESVFLSIRNFNDMCYSVAKNNVRRDMSEQKKFKDDTGDKRGWSFYPSNWGSKLMRNVYDNAHIFGTSSVSGILTMDVPDIWFDPSKRGKNQRCSILAKNLYDKIEADMVAEPNYKKIEGQVLAYTKMFNPKSNAAEVKHDLVNIIFDNAVNGDASKQLMWKDAQVQQSSFASFGAATPTMNGEQLQKQMEQFREKELNVMQSFSNVVVSIGSVFANIEESAKGLAVAMMLPAMIVITKLVLLGALPSLLVISGFSYKFLYNWILLYFAISLVPFWLALSLQLETLLLSMADYSESIDVHIDNIMEQNGVNIYLISSTAATFIYLIPTVWVMLVQIIGNISGSAFMNMVAGAAVVGQSGAQATTQGMFNTGKDLSRYTRGKMGKNNDGSNQDRSFGNAGGNGGGLSTRLPNRPG